MSALDDNLGLSSSLRTDGPQADPTAGLARLDDVRRWLQTAKENLPDLNNGLVAADRIAALSALVDRMHRVATAASARVAVGGRQRRAA